MRALFLAATAAAAATATALGVGSVLASGPHKARAAAAPRVETIKLTAKFADTESEYTDLGAKGLSLGDLRVTNVELLNAAGKRVGRVTASCAVIETGDDPGESILMNCTTAFKFAKGEILGGGVVDFESVDGQLRPAGDDVQALTGGTGRYLGVYGTVRFNIGEGVLRLHYPG
jgi:hypothetical protein